MRKSKQICTKNQILRRGHLCSRGLSPFPYLPLRTPSGLLLPQYFSFSQQHTTPWQRRYLNHNIFALNVLFYNYKFIYSSTPIPRIRYSCCSATFRTLLVCCNSETKNPSFSYSGPGIGSRYKGPCSCSFLKIIFIVLKKKSGDSIQIIN